MGARWSDEKGFRDQVDVGKSLRCPWQQRLHDLADRCRSSALFKVPILRETMVYLERLYQRGLIHIMCCIGFLFPVDKGLAFESSHRKSTYSIVKEMLVTIHIPALLSIHHYLNRLAIRGA